MNEQQVEYIKLFLNKCKIEVDNLNQYNAGCPPGFQPVSLLNGIIVF